MPKIEFINVTKIFGTKPERGLALLQKGESPETIREETGLTVALNNVSLSVQEGSTCAVIGLSGSGKSTLIRLRNHLIAPTSGDVRIDGVSIPGCTEEEILNIRRRKVSMVFQHFALLPHKTALANAAYGLDLQGIEKNTARERATHWLNRVGLKGFENAYPSELSGGMKQRVGLARALTTDPEILAMDEPYSALDPLIRREMQDQLLELQAELKKTLIFITHDIAEALRLGDQVAILRNGELVQCAAPADIVNNPANAYVEAFIQSIPKGLPQRT